MTEAKESMRVLLVDDDPVFIGRAIQALRPLACVQTINSGSAALAMMSHWKPDVILFDLLMPDLDGFSFLDALSHTPTDRQPVVLCTTDGRGAGTRVRLLPDWRVGTLVRSSSMCQLRTAVLQAVCGQDQDAQPCVTV